MNNGRETIFALSSGGLPTGVAVVRISGPGVRFGLDMMIGTLPEPRTASLRQIRDEAGRRLDEGIVIFFPGPGSFTGEDVVELQLHGSRAVVGVVLGVLGGLEGFRMAEAGEFTRRAFENGRLDLVQAEGLADLIGAETERQRRQALDVYEGRVSRVLTEWRERLVNLRALIEAELDFADEDDIPGAVSDQVWDGAEGLRIEIVNHVENKGGRLLRDGVDIVVVGAPNAGKSSLVNLLAGRDVAIVHGDAGTTRDMIEVRMDLGGVPVSMIDTAGLREAPEGAVEAEGIRRTRERAEAAEIVLELVDVGGEKLDTVSGRGSTGRRLIYGSKIDLVDSEMERSGVLDRFDGVMSVRTGEGVDELVDRLSGLVRDATAGMDAPVVTRERHQSMLVACVAHLSEAVEGSDLPLEIRAEALRAAGDELGRLTGRIDVEDLLDRIFSEFCVGK